MGWIVLFFCLGLMFLGGLLILTKIFSLVVFGAILIGVAIYLFFGLTDVQQQERRVVEFFGKYFMVLKPGLQWLLRGVMKVRATISVWEQQILLFTDQPATIVVRDGTVIPKEAKVFVKLKSPDVPYDDPEVPDAPSSPPDDSAVKKRSWVHRVIFIFRGGVKKKKRSGVYRAIYETPDWREFIEDRIENALRSYLGQFVVDDLVIEGKGGFNLADHRERVGLPNEELKLIENDLARWGWELLRITVTEFKLPPAMAKARDEIQIKKQQAEAARYQAEREAEETGGAVIQMFCKLTGMKREEVESALQENPEEFVKKYQSFWEKSWDTIYRKMAIDGKAYLDARTQNPLLDLITLWRRMPMSESKGEKREKQKEEKEGEED